ncbi:MAG: metal-dependent hydrolase [Myxococcota bacterium]|nr:metal-dependent hydrolase [Myxococcota bacterium]
MSDITVRKIRFSFEDLPIDLDVPDAQLPKLLGTLGLSMTMPYLEPYLIRTMKVALKRIEDEALAEDVRRFSQQEGHHYRNHANLNARIRDHFGGPVAAELQAIEAALEDDYQRFTRGKSLRFNVAYAEGFEAMTCAFALASAEHDGFEEIPGGEIWSWHMAEEIEHRTVAFDVYDHLVGSYAYRVAVGTWSQWHYLSYIRRFARCMQQALGRPLPRAPLDPAARTALRNYLRTWSPRYNPRDLPIPEGVSELLARYTEMARAS